MSTIKINELATADISLSDFFAKADANGIASKNTIQNLATLITTAGDVAFKGGLSIADTPTEGWYFATETGDYIIGGTTISVNVTNTLTIIIVPDVLADSYKVEVPLSYNVATEISEGNTGLAVSGDVFDAIKETELNEMLLNEIYGVLSTTINDDDVISSAVIQWQDGESGVVTMTDYNEDFTSYDGYNITYLGTPNKTLTQPTVTRDVDGNITIKPNKTIV